MKKVQKMKFFNLMRRKTYYKQTVIQTFINQLHSTIMMSLSDHYDKNRRNSKNRKCPWNLCESNTIVKTPTSHTQSNLLQHLTIQQRERKQTNALQSTKATDIGHRSNRFRIHQLNISRPYKFKI
jgi:hypothetical protein